MEMLTVSHLRKKDGKVEVVILDKSPDTKKYQEKRRRDPVELSSRVFGNIKKYLLTTTLK